MPLITECCYQIEQPINYDSYKCHAGDLVNRTEFFVHQFAYTSMTYPQRCFRPVFPKLCSADPNVSVNSTQGIRGFLSISATLNFAYFFKKEITFC
jgi:hypothetical protein